MPYQLRSGSLRSAINYREDAIDASASLRPRSTTADAGVAATAGAGSLRGRGHPASVTARANAALLLATFFEGEAKLLPLDPDRRVLDEWLFAMSSHIISSSKQLN